MRRTRILTGMGMAGALLIGGEAYETYREAAAKLRRYDIAMQLNDAASRLADNHSSRLCPNPRKARRTIANVLHDYSQPLGYNDSDQDLTYHRRRALNKIQSDLPDAESNCLFMDSTFADKRDVLTRIGNDVRPSEPYEELIRQRNAASTRFYGSGLLLLAAVGLYFYPLHSVHRRSHQEG